MIPDKMQAVKCPCGDPVCNQHTLTGQGSVGFDHDHALEIAHRFNNYSALCDALNRIRSINGSTRGPKALVAEFKHIANEAMAKALSARHEINVALGKPTT